MQPTLQNKQTTLLNIYDKSGKYLANQLKRNKEKSLISTITDSTGNITNDPQTINNVFREYYSVLYSDSKEKNATNQVQILSELYNTKPTL